MKLVEKLIKLKNEYGKNIQNKHPYIFKIMMGPFANKRYGYQLLDEQKNVLEEYTLVTDDNHIKGYESGLKNTFITLSLKKSLLEEMLKKDYTSHPFLTSIKYMPKYIYCLAKGDIAFGSRKKKR